MGFLHGFSGVVLTSDFKLLYFRPSLLLWSACRIFCQVWLLLGRSVGRSKNLGASVNVVGITCPPSRNRVKIWRADRPPRVPTALLGYTSISSSPKRRDQSWRVVSSKFYVMFPRPNHHLTPLQISEKLSNIITFLYWQIISVS